MKDSLIVNLSDPAVKRELMIQIGRLSGLHEILIRPRKRTRTLDQNAYYFAAVVAPFTEWLREVYGDRQIDKEQAHEMLKVKILGSNDWLLPNSESEKLLILPRSKTLTTDEFSDYIEKCAAWLAEFCEIVVVPSELFYENHK
jgi:hypothetical protein